MKPPWEGRLAQTELRAPEMGVARLAGCCSFRWEPRVPSAIPRDLPTCCRGYFSLGFLAAWQKRFGVCHQSQFLLPPFLLIIST